MWEIQMNPHTLTWGHNRLEKELFLSFHEKLSAAKTYTARNKDAAFTLMEHH